MHPDQNSKIVASKVSKTKPVVVVFNLVISKIKKKFAHDKSLFRQQESKKIMPLYSTVNFFKEIKLFSLFPFSHRVQKHVASPKIVIREVWENESFYACSLLLGNTGVRGTTIRAK